MTIVIGLQKSNYANGYYINVGYLTNKINPNIENPRDVDGEIRARFEFKKDATTVDFIDLDLFEDSDIVDLEFQIEENIKRYIQPVKSVDQLKKLLDTIPVLLFQTTILAKNFLGYE